MSKKPQPKAKKELPELQGEIRMLEIGKVRAYDRNAKKHPERQVDMIAESIKKFGFNQPIVVDIANVVIVGHGRLMAAEKLGLEKVPVITVDLSPSDAKAYRIADNKLNESAWDYDLLLSELTTLKEEDYQLDLTGYDEDEFAELIKQFGDIDMAGALGNLPSEEKKDLEQITFTLTGEQAENVRRAMMIAKEMGDFDTSENTNKNGNAIARVCDNFITDHGES